MKLTKRTPFTLAILAVLAWSAWHYLDLGHGDGLEPFTSDGCSAFPDGTIEYQDRWRRCCVAHDLAYWMGGTREQRKAADQALKQCVREVGEPEIAELMLQGVRVGGSPYWPATYRWGYGWPWPRGYEPLNRDEKTRVREELEKAAIDPSIPRPPALTGAAGTNTVSTTP